MSKVFVLGYFIKLQRIVGLYNMVFFEYVWSLLGVGFCVEYWVYIGEDDGVF